MDIMGVDVGGTYVRIGTLRDGAVEDLVKLRSKDVFGRGGAAAGLSRALAEYAAGKKIAAAGVGIPGTLSRDGETVLNVPNVPGSAELAGAPLKKILAGALGIPVFTENDITMLLTGDSRRLKLDGGLIFGCYIGTGMGGAVLYDGSLLRGHSALCEPGHIPVYGGTRRCGCGKTGCAEAYIAGRALEKLRDEVYTNCDIADIFTVMSREEKEKYTDILANILAAAEQLLDPDAVVMGGGVCAMRGFPREMLLDRLRGMCMKPVPAETLRLLYPEPSDDSGVYGAAVFAAGQLGATAEK